MSFFGKTSFQISKGSFSYYTISVSLLSLGGSVGFGEFTGVISTFFNMVYTVLVLEILLPGTI